jgi:hypothetical protein
VHHRTTIVAVRCAISFHIGRSRPLGLRTGWRTGHCLVHTGQSGVPNRLLARATRRPQIALVTVGSSGSDSLDSPVIFSRDVLGDFPRATSSSPMYLGAGAEDSPDSLVNFSHVAPLIPESAQLAPNQPGAPDSPLCQARASFCCIEPTLLHLFSSFLGTVSST